MFNILNLFKKEKPKSDSKQDKIKNMSVEEYNKYILNKHNYELQIAIGKVAVIIDQAYEDYVNDCKKNLELIGNSFYIRQNTYGLSYDTILKFMYEYPNIIIKNKYKINFYNSKVDIKYDALRVEVLN